MPMALRSRSQALNFNVTFPLKFLTAHIFQTIGWIWFIIGMIDISLNFWSAIPSHTPMILRSKS